MDSWEKNRYFSETFIFGLLLEIWGRQIEMELET